ncbi:hypothetical protein GCM10010470_17550 [Saccharopolyspora taberi]|uniref:Uncharacterized protein n=1 Tax=Saccharopolyspora taberi TaxID=60895 RepID=A0ABN3V8W8_9PSEU
MQSPVPHSGQRLGGRQARAVDEEEHRDGDGYRAVQADRGNTLRRKQYGRGRTDDNGENVGIGSNSSERTRNGGHKKSFPEK